MRLFQKHGAFICSTLLALIIVSYSCTFPFFWDTIQLGSQHANWFYTQGFNNLLPDNLDSGHCPVFGYYLALGWMLFGKSLVVSHFLMLPFLLCIFYYSHKVGSHLSDSKFGIYFTILLLCNPYFLGQAVLVSPDLALLAFFLICIDANLRSSNWQLLVGSLGLSLISQRGLMIVIALGAWLVLDQFLSERKFLAKSIYPILPGIILALSYQLIHYLSKGWVGYHDASPWVESFRSVDSLKSVFRNAGIFLWRLIDHGNFVIWLGLLAIVARGRLRDSRVLPVIIVVTFLFGIITIPKVGLLNHRYFLPIVIGATIVLLELMYNSTIRFKKYFILLIGIILLSGNYWRYPEGVARGWDTTIAHVPYYNLLDEALDFINTNQIDIDDVGAAFPLKNKLSDIYLNVDSSSFKQFDLDNDDYILYSDVMNDFQSEHVFELGNLWKPIFTKEKGHICIILFERQ